MKKKEKKVKKKDTLDMETTVADMNVEGFKWYDPTRKKGIKKRPIEKVTKKEYRAMVRGAYAAFLPVIVCVTISFALMVLLAYFWLK